MFASVMARIVPVESNRIKLREGTPPLASVLSPEPQSGVIATLVAGDIEDWYPSRDEAEAVLARILRDEPDFEGGRAVGRGSPLSDQLQLTDLETGAARFEPLPVQAV
jgi:hypothetical protein